MKHDRILIVGLGLIGGSLAAALKQSDFCQTVVGASRKSATVEKALSLGIIDQGVENWLTEVPHADIVVLCVPMGSYASLFELMKPHLQPNTIITDAGSVKQPVVNDALNVFGELPPLLVPGHPIAGSEKSGVSASNASLYQNHTVLLTPTQSSDPRACDIVASMWEAVGAKVKSLTPEHHDMVLAATSHLPHLLAFALVDTLAGSSENREIFEYAAGGFRDFTRIAASDPTMWHDIFLSNASALLEVLDQFSSGVDALKQAINDQDSEAMLGVFTRAKAAREHFSVVLEKRAYASFSGRGSDFRTGANTNIKTSINKNINKSTKTDTEINLGNDPDKETDNNTEHSSLRDCGIGVKNEMKPLHYIANPSQSVKGSARVPGDKSISHRAIMLGSLAVGKTHVTGWLEGEDALATLQAFRDLGVVIEGPTEGSLTIHGVGLNGLKTPPGPLYLGNSGTSMRLLAGLMAGQSFSTTLTGDASLSKRPMGRVANPLKAMGAEIATEEDGTPPVEIKPASGPLKAADYTMPIASAQVKSSLLLAGLYATGTTWVEEPAPTRDHTERMFSGFGVSVEREEIAPGQTRIGVRGGQTLTATDIDVPADISSAAFFLVAASIAPGSELLLQHVGINPTRVGIYNLLKLMGADITLQNQREVGGEPVADILVRSAELKGIDIPVDQVPLAIDEFPVLFVAAACAEGVTRLTGAEELRVKESDRIQAMADGLAALGIDVEPQPDGIIIQGKGQTSQSSQSENQPAPIFSGGEVESHDDHRIAMSFAIASLRASAPILIKECDNVATSFPDFVGLANRLGLNIDVEG